MGSAGPMDQRPKNYFKDQIENLQAKLAAQLDEFKGDEHKETRHQIHRELGILENAMSEYSTEYRKDG